jgi:hypothetical protein
MSVREPLLHSVALKDLRPTQMTVGLREVAAKRAHWRTVKHPEEYLGRHLIPVVLGFKQRYYLIDHHHLARALYEEGVSQVAITVVADLSQLEQRHFYTVLDHKGWLHPYDEDGKRRHYDDLPTSVDELTDDPYRSLAGELRHAGGFAKDTTPFSEFLWADFLRMHIKSSKIDKRFNEALAEALELARSKHAAYLPGWCGPTQRA